jgi:hypothetical protein
MVYESCSRSGSCSFLQWLPKGQQKGCPPNIIWLESKLRGPGLAKTRHILYYIILLYISRKNILISLKILTIEKRGGLKEVTFDRSPFKLFTLRFSNKSVQAPSCERPRTAPLLSLANNNCFQIAV